MLRNNEIFDSTNDGLDDWPVISLVLKQRKRIMLACNHLSLPLQLSHENPKLSWPSKKEFVTDTSCNYLSAQDTTGQSVTEMQTVCKRRIASGSQTLILKPSLIRPLHFLSKKQATQFGRAEFGAMWIECIQRLALPRGLSIRQ